MESFLKDLLTTYRERLKSTFFSSFVLAWIGWNWKYFYITLFVSEKALNGHANKFNYLASIDTNGYVLLWFPLLTSSLYILLLTPTNWAVNSFVEFFKLQAKNTRIKIWEKEKFSKDEIEELRKVDKKEINEKQDEINDFEKRLAKKDREIEIANEKNSQFNNEIEKLNRSIESQEILIKSNNYIPSAKTLEKIEMNFDLWRKIDDNNLTELTSIDNKSMNSYFSLDDIKILNEFQILINNNNKYQIDNSKYKELTEVSNILQKTIEDSETLKSEKINSLSDKKKEMVRFLKFEKLIKAAAYLNVPVFDELIKENKIFDYTRISRYRAVDEFLQNNDYVEIYEKGEYASLTKEFTAFFNNYKEFLN